MAGWSAIPVVAGNDMSLRTTYLELMTAWNERRQALGSGTISNPAAGDPCFDSAAAYAIKAMQQWIETNCTSFVVSHDAGSPPTERAAGYYTGAATIPMYTTATLRSTAGLNSSGFKKTATPTYGICGAGDIVLVEHFNEIRLCLNVMKWTLKVAAYDNHSESNDISVNGTGFTSPWHAAYLDAVSNWVPGAATSQNSPNALAYCVGSTDGGGGYNCSLSRRYLYGEFTSIPTFAAHVMDAYLKNTVPQIDEANSTFFAHGDGTLNNQFYLIQTFGSATTSTRTTGKIGSIVNPPSEGPAPTAGPPANFADYGWESQPGGGGTTYPQGVLRWAMTYY